MAKTRITKRKKETTVDRLSSLSDHLLLYILGNLETLDAVRTCVLSQRWRSLWKSLPNIFFTGPLSNSFRASKKTERAFSNLVTQVILRRDHSDLLKLRLLPHCRTDPYLVEAFLEYVIKHNVKFIEFGVYAYGDQLCALFPRCFFNCSSLQGLELRYVSYACIRWPRHLNWPALKFLYLENFVLGEGKFDGRIFSSCPSLETLKLVSFRTPSYLQEKTLHIHCLSLRSLELVYTNYENHFLDAHMIVIVAPKLTTFKFTGHKPVICSVDATSLENVIINLCPGTDLYSSSQVSFNENARETILRSIKMVNEFHLAKSLSMAVDTVEVLSALPDLLEVHLRKFENLKVLKLMMPLKLGKCFSMSPRTLNYFLSSSTAFKLEGVENKLWW